MVFHFFVLMAKLFLYAFACPLVWHAELSWYCLIGIWCWDWMGVGRIPASAKQQKWVTCLHEVKTWIPTQQIHKIDCMWTILWIFTLPLFSHLWVICLCHLVRVGQSYGSGYPLVPRMDHPCGSKNPLMTRMDHPCGSGHPLVPRIDHPCGSGHPLVTRMEHPYGSGHPPRAKDRSSVWLWSSTRDEDGTSMWLWSSTRAEDE